MSRKRLRNRSTRIRRNLASLTSGNRNPIPFKPLERPKIKPVRLKLFRIRII